MSPPGWWLCSRTRTRWPRWHSSEAATSPAIPAPTTIASKRPSAAARASFWRAGALADGSVMWTP